MCHFAETEKIFFELKAYSVPILGLNKVEEIGINQGIIKINIKTKIISTKIDNS